MKYDLSVTTGMLMDWTYTESINHQIERITNAGFKFLDFSFDSWVNEANSNVTKSPFLLQNWESWIESAKETAEKNGARFNQGHAPASVFSCGTDYDLYIKYVKRAIDCCNILGIKWLVHHAVTYPNQFGSSLSWLEFNKKAFCEILEYSKKKNVGVAIENMWPVWKLYDREQWNTEILIELVDNLNDDLVGICWDTGHGNLTANARGFKLCNHPELLEYGNQYNEIIKMGKRLKCLHIHDNNGMDDDHILPFTGSINWKDVMRGLSDIQYTGAFTYEANSFIENLPEECKDDAIRLMYSVGKSLIEMNF